MKKHYVYKITHKTSNCYYIGIRSCEVEIGIDPYMGSGVLITRFINKYGKENFSKEILYEGVTREDISLKEEELVTSETLLDPLCLNLRTGGDIDRSYTYHPDVNIQISNSLKKYYSVPENLKALSERTKNYYINNPEARNFISEMRKRVCKDPEHIRKTKEARKKLFETTDIKLKIKEGLNRPEVKKKRSQSIKKACNTPEGLERLSKATKNTKYMTKDGVDARVNPEDVNNFLQEGWVLGRSNIVSEDTRSKISEKSKNLVWVFNDETKKCKRIKNDLVDFFLQNNLDWKKGFRKW